MAKSSTVWAALLFCTVVNVAFADTLAFSGRITQPSANQPGNNPSLSSVALNDAYTVVLTINGAINSTGTFTNFAGAVFNDTTASVSETSFGTISLTISSDGLYDDFSLLACLTTGSGCLVGNQLAANFQVLTTDLNAASAGAQSIPSLMPVELFEDDGVTDIQGTVTTYAYTATPQNLPEPASWVLPGSLLMGLMGRKRLLRSRK